jgi:hypothetical protein
MARNLQMNDASSPSETSSVTNAVGLVLRRIVRLMVGTISFPALVDILKTLYVEEAEKKINQSGSKPTMSALALLTGLDTRVVSVVMNKEYDITIEPKNICAENALLDMWANDPFFSDPDTKQPLVLPIEGRGRTFQGLVLKSIGRNITIKTVLDKLLTSGNIRTISDGVEQVELLSLFYSPITNDRANMTDIAFVESSRVLSAAIHNMESDVDSRVPQQGRWTYRLCPKRYKEFRQEARLLLQKQIKEGEALLENFEDPQKRPGQLTVGIGWYQWGGHNSDEEGAQNVSLDNTKQQHRNRKIRHRN